MFLSPSVTYDNKSAHLHGTVIVITIDITALEASQLVLSFSQKSVDADVFLGHVKPSTPVFISRGSHWIMDSSTHNTEVLQHAI